MSVTTSTLQIRVNADTSQAQSAMGGLASTSKASASSVELLAKASEGLQHQFNRIDTKDVLSSVAALGEGVLHGASAFDALKRAAMELAGPFGGLVGIAFDLSKAIYDAAIPGVTSLTGKLTGLVGSLIEVSGAANTAAENLENLEKARILGIQSDEERGREIAEILGIKEPEALNPSRDLESGFGRLEKRLRAEREDYEYYLAGEEKQAEIARELGAARGFEAARGQGRAADRSGVSIGGTLLGLRYSPGGVLAARGFGAFADQVQDATAGADMGRGLAGLFGRTGSGLSEVFSGLGGGVGAFVGEAHRETAADRAGDFMAGLTGSGDQSKASLAMRLGAGGFQAFQSGIAASVEAAITGSESIGKAFRKASAASLAAKAAQWSVEALGEGAYAISSLAFGDFTGAASHGAAALKFAAAAAAAGIAAHELGGGGGGSASRAASGGGGGGGGGSYGAAGGGYGGFGHGAAVDAESHRPIVVQIGYGFVGDEKKLGAEIHKAVREAKRTGYARDSGALGYS